MPRGRTKKKKKLVWRRQKLTLRRRRQLKLETESPDWVDRKREEAEPPPRRVNLRQAYVQ